MPLEPLILLMLIPILALPDRTCHSEDTGTEVTTKSFLHQNKKNIDVYFRAIFSVMHRSVSIFCDVDKVHGCQFLQQTSSWWGS